MQPSETKTSVQQAYISFEPHFFPFGFKHLSCTQRAVEDPGSASSFALGVSCPPTACGRTDLVQSYIDYPIWAQRTLLPIHVHGGFWIVLVTSDHGGNNCRKMSYWASFLCGIMISIDLMVLLGWRTSVPNACFIHDYYWWAKSYLEAPKVQVSPSTVKEQNRVPRATS